MTCKNCLHYEACKYWAWEAFGADTQFPYNQPCEHFKPKSRFIELPCAVGDTVYRTRGNYCGVKIHEGVVDQISIYKDGVIRFWVLGHPLGFACDDIGNTVFLTKEEAEKAVERSEGK